MNDLHGVRVAGPLAPYARGFAVELARLGYRSGWARKQLRLAAHLSGWLEGAGLDADSRPAIAGLRELIVGSLVELRPRPEREDPETGRSPR